MSDRESLQLKKITIGSILNGIAPVSSFGDGASFLMSVGIDPEESVGTLNRPSGAIIPALYAAKSGSEVTEAPMYVSGAQTSTGVFAYLQNGSIVTYSNTLTYDESFRGPDLGEGNGMVVYNDYMYVASGDDILRFGDLSTTGPTLSSSYWVTTLGMSALTNSQFPSTRSVDYPNHVLFRHNDGYVYVADYDGANGRIHRFITDYDGTDGSGEWDVLQLPPGMMPTSIASYGVDLAILCTPEAKYASGDIPESEEAVLYLWDTVATNSFYRAIPTGEMIGTKVINKDGRLYVFAGNIDTSSKILLYGGGYEFYEVAAIYDGSPPPDGAVDVKGDMLAWGQHLTYPYACAGVMSLGYRDGKMPKLTLGHVMRISDVSGNLPMVTALKFLRRTKYPLVGWRTSAGYGLDEEGSSGDELHSTFMSQMFQIGRKFNIRRIVAPLSAKVAQGMDVSLSVYTDNELSSFTADGEGGLKRIHVDNYTDSEMLIDMRDLTIGGLQSFYLRADFGGTVRVGLQYPIDIYYETYD